MRDSTCPTERVGSILVVNAGSTSLKLRVVAEDESSVAVDALEQLDPSRIDAVAHRVVHGGARFREPVLIDTAVREENFGLEPLHNRAALAGIEAAERAFPARPHIAVVDTAFHATMPDEAAVYALAIELDGDRNAAAEPDWSRGRCSGVEVFPSGLERSGISTTALRPG